MQSIVPWCFTAQVQHIFFPQSMVYKAVGVCKSETQTHMYEQQYSLNFKVLPLHQQKIFMTLGATDLLLSHTPVSYYCYVWQAFGACMELTSSLTALPQKWLPNFWRNKKIISNRSRQKVPLNDINRMSKWPSWENRLELWLWNKNTCESLQITVEWLKLVFYFILSINKDSRNDLGPV